MCTGMFTSRVWCAVFFSATLMLFIGSSVGPAKAHCAGNHTGNHPHCAGEEPPPPEVDPTFRPVLVYIDETGIVVANADGSSPVTVWPDQGYVDWSADGTEIVFSVAFSSSQLGIFRQKLFDENGKFSIGVPQPIFDPQFLTGISWSRVPAPDGKHWIAFTQGDATGETDLYLVHPDTGQTVQLTDTNEDCEYTPSWSPDGKRLMFVSRRMPFCGPQEGFPDDIVIADVVLNSDTGLLELGNKVSLLRDNPDYYGSALEGAQPWYPHWSNAMDRISFTNLDTAGPNTIFVMPSSPENAIAGAYDILPESNPDVWRRAGVWSPDDSALAYFTRGVGGECALPGPEPKKGKGKQAPTPNYLAIGTLDDPSDPNADNIIDCENENLLGTSTINETLGWWYPPQAPAQ